MSCDESFLNKIRRLAEELTARYPTLFSNDFDKNKEALSTVSVIHTRSLRNQLAGAITKIMHSRSPPPSELGEAEHVTGSTLEERELARTAKSGTSPTEIPLRSDADLSQEKSDQSQQGNEQKQEQVSQPAQ